MKIEIVNERENPLLNRKEIRFNVSYEGATPHFLDVRKKLVSALKSDEKLTILDGIKTEFGRNIAAGYVKIYADEKSMDVEPKHRIKKNFRVGEKTEEKEERKPEKEEKTEKIEEERKPEKEEKTEEKTEKIEEGRKPEKEEKREEKMEKVEEKKEKTEKKAEEVKSGSVGVGV